MRKPSCGSKSAVVMQAYDIVVVGGGPAGAVCAQRLIAAGRAVAVLDRETFPRTKLCAGWITPEVVQDLALDIDAYPYKFMTFNHIVVHIKGLTFKLPGPQHSIRRYEFDDFLLRSCGADVVNHKVKDIVQDNDGFVIDDQFRCNYLVGAAGTRCPVYRTFFREANPRAKELQASTYEYEFPYSWSDPRCHLWFFNRGLPGYSWYVPKANGYVNCGIGAMAETLKDRGDNIKDHWQHFTKALGDRSFIENADFVPKGYSYYLRGNVGTVRIGNAFITGDASGLATRDLCEGIGPAIRSGQLAAESILHGSTYSLETISRFSSRHLLVRKFVEYMVVKRGIRRGSSAPLAIEHSRVSRGA